MKYSVHIVGYSKTDPVGNLEDKVVIRLVDTDVNNALERAKKLINKDNWFIGEIIEIVKPTK